MDAPRTDVLRASPRMFESNVLDRLSRVHPAVPVIIFLPAISVLFALSIGRVGALAMAGLLVAGYVFWSLSEYWIHRAIFHFEPEESRSRKFDSNIRGEARRTSVRGASIAAPDRSAVPCRCQRDKAQRGVADHRARLLI